MDRFRLIKVLRVALMPALVWAIYLLKGNLWFRLYPVLMVSLAFVIFFVSLFRTPLVESVARRTGEILDVRARRYCRTVTVVWTVFLALHLLVTAGTVFASREAWAFYNGFLAYVMMGLLFAGEWMIRGRIRRG